MTHSTFTSLSKLFFYFSVKGQKEKGSCYQRLKSFPDQVPFAPSYLIHISPVVLLLNKYVVGLIRRPQSCTHWLFYCSTSAECTDHGYSLA